MKKTFCISGLHYYAAADESVIMIPIDQSGSDSKHILHL